MVHNETEIIANSIVILRNKAKELKSQGKSYSEIGKELGIAKETARRYVLDLSRSVNTPGVGKVSVSADPPKTPAELIEQDYRTVKLRDQAVTSQRKYNELLKRHLELEDRYDSLVELKATEHHPIRIDLPEDNTKSEAVAIALASDWHVGQRIDSNTVNNLNEYNPDICKSRSTNYFTNLLKLIEKERQDVVINKVVLWLGGDFLSGLIHPELVEDNYMSPLEEVIFAQELLQGGIQFLLEHGNFTEIILPCSFGNHGRLAEKKKIATAYKNNFEWLLYRTLAQFFESEDKIKFQIADGYFNYLPIFGQTLRFSHGDNVKSGGGVGGVSIPLNKYIFKSNQQSQSSMDFLGHFHQFTRGTNFVINGSLCGFDTFALSIGASPERPQQAFQLLDSRRNFTISAPILVE